MSSNKVKRHRFSLEDSVILLLIAFIILMILCQYVPINITMPIIILSGIGIFAGLMLPTIISTWLIIFSVVIGAFLVILGYVLIPVYERTMVVLTLPIMIGLASFVKRRTHQIDNLQLSEDNIVDYVTSHNIVTDLPNSIEAVRYYERNIRALEKLPSKVSQFSVILFYWAHNDQYEQLDPNEWSNVMRYISNHLNHLRLPSEHIYDIESGSFLVISPIDQIELLHQLNENTIEELETISFITDLTESFIQIQCGEVIVTHDNVEQYHTYDEVLRKLERCLETDVIREY